MDDVFTTSTFISEALLAAIEKALSNFDIDDADNKECFEVRKVFYDGNFCFYCGVLVDGLPQGFGVLLKEVTKTGKPTTFYVDYKGYWKGGKPHGYGSEFFSSGQLSYMGQYKNGKWHGDGKLFSGFGLVEGCFQDGVLSDGFAKYYYCDNRTLKIYGILSSGDWLQAKWYDAHGLLIYQGGISGSVGFVAANKREGYGIQYNRDGSRLSGIWSNNVLIKPMDLPVVEQLLKLANRASGDL